MHLRRNETEDIVTVPRMHATAVRTQPVEPVARPTSPFMGRPPANVAYATPCGRMLHGKSDEILTDGSLARFEGKVNLIFTSPPFPLNRKKRYGNETGEACVKWLCAFGPLFKKMLAPDGSVVVEMGKFVGAGHAHHVYTCVARPARVPGEE